MSHVFDYEGLMLMVQLFIIFAAIGLFLTISFERANVHDKSDDKRR